MSKVAIASEEIISGFEICPNVFLTERVGAGSFGEIWRASIKFKEDRVVPCAVKIEGKNVVKKVLRLEIYVYEKMQNNKHFGRLLYYGKYGENQDYMVMELLGPSLSLFYFLCFVFFYVFLYSR
jgi:serine/threonine protein kinase